MEFLPEHYACIFNFFQSKCLNNSVKSLLTCLQLNNIYEKMRAQVCTLTTS